MADTVSNEGISMVCRHYFISGRVQGVGYRQFAYKQAATLGLAGWVRNLGDGRVEVTVQGEASGVSEFVSRLNQGPMLAKVTGIQEEPMTDSLENFTGFTILR